MVLIHDWHDGNMMQEDMFSSHYTLIVLEDLDSYQYILKLYDHNTLVSYILWSVDKLIHTLYFMNYMH